MINDDLPIWQNTIEAQLTYVERTLGTVQSLYNRRDVEDALKCMPRIKSAYQNNRAALAKLQLKDDGA